MNTNAEHEKPVAVIGAGVTGLAAAYVLHDNGVPVEVLEAEKVVGGASMTVQFNGFRFDLGGHRFYTRNQPVLDLVRELLGDELLTVPRQSRIYMGGKLVDYPLTFFNALAALGPVNSLGVGVSYAWQKMKGLFRSRPEKTFEDWVVSRFGRQLYNIYFKPYSEKVWGVPCAELTADFAEQRIRGLSFREAVRNMLFKKKDKPATLVSQFIYPRLGFGRIPESMAERLSEDAVKLESPVTRLEHDGKSVTAVVCRKNEGETRMTPGHVISTIAVTDLIRRLSPAAPNEVVEAAEGLRYRDMVIVFLTLNRKQVTPDQWIYFSSDDVFFGRMHEPKNWSRAMSPEDKTSLVVEIFCYEGEPVWNESDESATRHVVRRLAELGMIEEREVESAKVIRLKKAYPLYVGDYLARLDTVMGYLKRFENLQTVGRNGLFRYTSGDYYIEMGMKAAENVLGHNHEIDQIGTAREYAEK